MRIFPKFRHDEVEKPLTPQTILAGLLMAVKGQSLNEVEQMHLASALSGPATDNLMVRAIDLKQLIQSSEKTLSAMGFEDFLRKSAPVLTDKQKLATLVTIMDLCMVENSLMDGEKAVFERIRDEFQVADEALRPYEAMLILKNETSIRLNVLPPSFNRAAEGFRSLV